MKTWRLLQIRNASWWNAIQCSSFRFSSVVFGFAAHFFSYFTFSLESPNWLWFSLQSPLNTMRGRRVSERTSALRPQSNSVGWADPCSQRPSLSWRPLWHHFLSVTLSSFAARPCFQYLTLVYRVISRSCCENAWLCADVSVYTATQINPYERTSHHFFSLLSLSLPPSVFFFLSLLTAGPELGRCIWVAARQGRLGRAGGGGCSLLISRVCSVLISALVSSPYSVSSVWLTLITTRYQNSRFIWKRQNNDCNVV